MSITTTNINTGGAVVKVGGTVIADPADAAWFDMSPTGTDIGCTTGGVSVTYTIETSDVFCDQVTAPVETAIVGETATVEFDMLESNAENIKLALNNQATAEDGTDAYYVGVGGSTSISFAPLELSITDNDTGYLTKWLFFRTVAGGIETSFERETPTAVGVTFTAYADADHASGKQLFQVAQMKA